MYLPIYNNLLPTFIVVRWSFAHNYYFNTILQCRKPIDKREDYDVDCKEFYTGKVSLRIRFKLHSNSQPYTKCKRVYAIYIYCVRIILLLL